MYQKNLCFVVSSACCFCLRLQKDEPKDQNAKMIKILSGEMAIELHLQFLIRNNNTDLMILKNTKVIKLATWMLFGICKKTV